MRSRLMPLCVIALVVAAPAAMADFVQIHPNHDNTLYQDPTGSLSNGAGNGFFAGTNAQSLVRRGLVSFDIAAAVPAGATVTGVSLQLHMSSAQATAATVSLDPVLASWGEGTSDAGAAGGNGAPATPGDATWTYRFFNTLSWANVGGDFSAVPSASTSVAGVAFYTWSSAVMASDVQAWLNNPSTDFGWMVVGAEGTAGSAKKFDSREVTDPSLAPVLSITYTVPGPSGLALLGIAGLGATRRKR